MWPRGSIWEDSEELFKMFGILLEMLLGFADTAIIPSCLLAHYAAGSLVQCCFVTM